MQNYIFRRLLWLRGLLLPSRLSLDKRYRNNKGTVYSRWRRNSQGGCHLQAIRQSWKQMGKTVERRQENLWFQLWLWRLLGRGLLPLDANHEHNEGAIDWKRRWTYRRRSFLQTIKQVGTYIKRRWQNLWLQVWLWRLLGRGLLSLDGKNEHHTRTAGWKRGSIHCTMCIL